MTSEFDKIFKMGSFGQLCSYARRMEYDIDPDSLEASADEQTAILAKIGAEWLRANPRVDMRERAGVFNIMEEFGFEVVVLDVGDVVTKYVGFERKSGDFFSSVFDRRIFKQMHEIKRDFSHAFLVIDRPLDDLFREAATRKISDNSVFGALASCCVRGFPPLFMDNKVWATTLMNAVARKTMDGRNRTEEYDGLRGTAGSSNMVEHMLLRLPNFGGKAVSIIMENINGGSLQDALDLICSVPDMPKEQLKETGLSKIRAKCIKAKKLITEPQETE